MTNNNNDGVITDMDCKQLAYYYVLLRGLKTLKLTICKYGVKTYSKEEYENLFEEFISKFTDKKEAKVKFEELEERDYETTVRYICMMNVRLMEMRLTIFLYYIITSIMDDMWINVPEVSLENLVKLHNDEHFQSKHSMLPPEVRELYEFIRKAHENIKDIPSHPTLNVQLQLLERHSTEIYNQFIILSDYEEILDIIEKTLTKVSLEEDVLHKKFKQVYNCDKEILHNLAKAIIDLNNKEIEINKK